MIADTLMRGRAEGMREAIAQHFGPPSAALERRIAADERALSDLLDRLTGADGPSDLLAN